MIIWSKTNTESKAPDNVELKSVRAKEEKFTPPDLVIMGFKRKKSSKATESFKFLSLFDKNKFLKLCIRSNKQDIINRLLNLSRLKMFSNKSYRVRRRGSHYVKKDSKCLSCGSPAQVAHHVIMVSNGGPDRRGNIVELCRSCHAEIHPWLKEQK